MSANYPIVERITQDLEATLRGMTESAGYAFDAIVTRHSRLGDAIGEIPTGSVRLVLKENDEEPVEDHAQNHHFWVQDYTVIAYIAESETSSVPDGQRVSTVKAELQRRLLEDPTRGALAVDTELFGSVRGLDSESGIITIEVTFGVHYRTLYGDPYSL